MKNWLLASFLIIAGASTVAAQPISPNDVISPASKSVQDDSSLGIPVGGFIVSVGAEASELYDDNIFRVADRKTEDFLTEIKPALAIQSNWNRHSLYAGGLVDFGSYANRSRGDFVNANVVASGVYDVAPETEITGSVLYEQWRSGSGEGANLTGSSEKKYTTMTERVGFSRELSVFQATVEAENSDIDLVSSDSASASGDTDSRNDKNLKTTVSYAIDSKNGIYIQNKVERASYRFFGSTGRSVDGVDFRGGVRTKIESVLTADLFGGYLSDRFSNPGGHSETTYWGFNVSWTITPLLTAHAIVDRFYMPTVDSGSLGSVVERRKLSLDQAIGNRTVWTVSGGFDDYDYVGRASSLSRGNRQCYGGSSITYKFNEHTALRAAYDYARRVSDVYSEKFKDNQVKTSLVYMF